MKRSRRLSQMITCVLPLLSVPIWASPLPQGVVKVLPINCQQLEKKEYKFQVHRLTPSSEAKLWMVACGTGAYQTAYSLVYQSENSVFRPLLFAQWRDGSWTGTDQLFDPIYNEKTGELSDRYKLVGTGQCGGERKWRWQDRQFKLISYRAEDDCSRRGGKEYAQVYPPVTQR